MKASIYSQQYLIGHADLQPGDVTMGGVYGEFIPTAEYHNRVQQTVWDVGAGIPPKHERWEALLINAQLQNGYFLFPMGGYELIDSPNFPHESIRIYLTGIDAEIIEDFIAIDPPRTFVEEPWEPLTIQQKVALEAELDRELGSALRAPSAGGARSSHALAKAKFSALCKFGPSDDVLFSIHLPASPTSHFALVHLTWSGSKEVHPDYPRTLFFTSFAEFKLERMYPDKSEWE